MESLHETDVLTGQPKNMDQASTKDTELPYLSRGEHRDAQLPEADHRVWGDHLGAAGEQFERGVHDPDHLLSPKEVAAAEQLAHDGAMVSALQVDTPLYGHVDGLVIVRTSETDAGTPTALVNPETGSPEAIAVAVDLALGRLADFGACEVVVDGRDLGLTAEGARAGWDLAKDTGRETPDRMHALLADKSMHTFPE